MTDKKGIKPLTSERLHSIQARIQPGTFLATFASKLEAHGDAMLEGLFEIASGHISLKKDKNGDVYEVSVSDRLAAIRLIMELGAFKDVAKALLKIAMKGRPVDGSDTEIPEWAARYADAEPVDADFDVQPAPPKKPRKPRKKAE